MFGHGLEDEAGIGTSRSDAEVLRRSKYGTPLHDDDLLVNADHLVCLVDAVECEPKGFTLPKPGTRAEENKQRVPGWHDGGQGEDLAGTKQLNVCPDDLREPDVCTGWCGGGLADVKHHPAQSTGAAAVS
jgi:hypothetical protein